MHALQPRKWARDVYPNRPYFYFSLYSPRRGLREEYWFVFDCRSIDFLRDVSDDACVSGCFGVWWMLSDDGGKI